MAAQDRAHASGVDRLQAMREALFAAQRAGGKQRDTDAPSPRCQAQQYSDQMQCGRCGLTWDMNDPDPPKCSPVERRLTVRREEDR